jgi:hypothetical protein
MERQNQEGRLTEELKMEGRKSQSPGALTGTAMM